MGESIGHNIERAAFSAVISKAVKNVNQDRAKYMIKYMDLAEKALKGQWKPQAFERMRNVFRNPDSKWMQYTNRMFDNVDPEIIKMAALNLAYEAGFRGSERQSQSERNSDAIFRGFFSSILQAHVTFTALDAGLPNMVIRKLFQMMIWTVS